MAERHDDQLLEDPIARALREELAAVRVHTPPLEGIIEVGDGVAGQVGRPSQRRAVTAVMGVAAAVVVLLVGIVGLAPRLGDEPVGLGTRPTDAAPLEAAETASPTGAGAVVDGTEWRSAVVEGLDLPVDQRIALTFEDGRVEVEVACNSVGGPFELVDGQLVVDQAEFGSTLMECPQPQSSWDGWVSNLLLSSPTVVLDDQSLTLTVGQSTVIFDRHIEPGPTPTDLTTPLSSWVEPSDYRYIISGSCSSARFFGEREVTVRDGIPSAPEAHLPVLIADAEAVRAGAHDVVRVEHDPESGHPTQIFWDVDLDSSTDDEVCYNVLDYQVFNMGPTEAPVGGPPTEPPWRGSRPEGQVPTVITEASEIPRSDSLHPDVHGVLDGAAGSQLSLRSEHHDPTTDASGVPTFSSSYLDQDGHPWHVVIDRTDEASMAATLAAESDGVELPSERLSRLILLENDVRGIQLLGWQQTDDGTLYFINLTTPLADLEVDPERLLLDVLGAFLQRDPPPDPAVGDGE